eukprot:1188405-Prorocentrum_minimum.AAC.1
MIICVPAKRAPGSTGGGRDGHAGVHQVVGEPQRKHPFVLLLDFDCHRQGGRLRPESAFSAAQSAHLQHSRRTDSAVTAQSQRSHSAATAQSQRSHSAVGAAVVQSQRTGTLTAAGGGLIAAPSESASLGIVSSGGGLSWETAVIALWNSSDAANSCQPAAEAPPVPCSSKGGYRPTSAVTRKPLLPAGQWHSGAVACSKWRSGAVEQLHSRSVACRGAVSCPPQKGARVTAVTQSHSHTVTQSRSHTVGRVGRNGLGRVPPTEGPEGVQRDIRGGPEGIQRGSIGQVWGSRGGPEGIYRPSLDARMPQNSTKIWGPIWALEGIYRSSLYAREPQNPTNSEEYQGYLQGVLYIV